MSVQTASAEPPDAPLPEVTPQTLAAKIEDAWKAYDVGSIALEFEEERDANGPVGNAPPILVKIPGRVRRSSDGVRWRVEYESKRPLNRSRTLVPDRWTTGFDGQNRFKWEENSQLLTLGDWERSADLYAPRALFWYEGKSVVRGLREPGITISQRTVDGVRCYVLADRHGDYSSETVISPRQGYLQVRTTWRHKDQMYLTYRLYEPHQPAPGVWVPRRIYLQTRHGSGFDLRRMTRVVQYEPGKAPEPAAFGYTIPIEADVTDLRRGDSYHNDPWWPEASKWLRDRYDWPPMDLSPLSQLQTRDAMSAVEGKPAPPLRASAWIGSEPLTWDQFKGKVVLVVFWDQAINNNRTAPLRRLYEIYHPAGLEIVAIHTPLDDAESIRQYAREYQLPYPIAVDTGDTARAFGTDGGEGAVVVDREGKIHGVGGPNGVRKTLIDRLVSLLKQAGAPAVKPISLDWPRPSDAMIRALHTEFAAWPAATPSRITGTVTDGEGRPIDQVHVVATLRLSLLMSPQPGAYFMINSAFRRTATSGPDGRFDVTGLCKGTYNLTYEAKGRATYEENASIAPDLKPVIADGVLAQGDTIAGLVVDDEGNPIRGARVEITQRSYERNGRTTTTNGIGAGVSTDADGRFVLSHLSFGHYTLAVTAAGFARKTFAKVPAGSADVELKVTSIRPR